ncbi:MAG TPA: discoidin domain-containing protein [Jatrophihabitans sp.]|nr:discoidin domain-containing protein [Jatrophihabitans sp.]
MRRLVAAAGALALALGATVAGTSPAGAVTTYDRQLATDSGLFLINGPDHAAAQRFTTSDAHVHTVSAFLVSNSAVGTLDAQIRTDVTDPTTTIASSSVDLTSVGGSGEGWIDFPVDATLTAGQSYYLVLQATGAAGNVVWNGTKSALDGALPSWNYDVGYWGGWQAYDFDGWVNFHAAFGIDLSGADGCQATNTCYKAIPAGDLAAYTAGLLGNGTTSVALTPFQAYGASYVPDGNVLQLPDGDWRYLPAGASEPVTVPAGDRRALAQIAASRAWLAAGTVPGRTGAEKAMAARALLTLRLLTQPNGAVAAAWYGAWKYSWPRDASFIAAAFAATGHPDDAYRILTYNAQTQHADGTWDARTKLDGSGPPDGRHWQLDANGWVPWAVWEWYQAASGSHRNEQLRALYPMIEKAADYAANSLDGRGLPPAEPDYWEVGTTTPNIGTAAPLLSGLHASADLARITGHPSDADVWSDAAGRLATGIARYFAPQGYPRTVDGLHGRDSAVTFMAPPFNQAPADLGAAIDDTYQALLRSNGGVVPGNDPSHTWTNSWGPETAFFAVAWSGIGRPDRAEQVVNWLVAHRNMLGELPEQISPAGDPASVVPLAWTGAVTLLALAQLDGPVLPVPPRPCALPDQSSGQCTAPGPASRLSLHDVTPATVDIAGPGDIAQVHAQISNPGPAAATDVSLALQPPAGWSVQSTSDVPASVSPGGTAAAGWQLSAPADADPGLYTATLTLRYVSGGHTGTLAQHLPIRLAVISHAGMVATADSAQEPTYDARYAVDDDPTTLWHSQYSPYQPLPHAITVDLGDQYHVSGLIYQPRQDNNANGNITSYTISVSSDGTNFADVAVGDWVGDATTKTARFPDQTARYVRLTALAGHGGLASAAEINVLGIPAR